MNTYFKTTSLVAVVLLFYLASVAQTIVPLKTSVDSLSYAIGVNVGENLKRQGVNANVEVFAQAIKDVLASKKLVISAEESNNFIQSYFEKEFAKKANANKTAGVKFLAENKTKPGIVTTASGLQYQVLVAGTGEKPTSADRVKVHYQGSLLDGTVFDSSIKRGEPATFGVTQVISGWVEALQLMPVGSKWKLFIPSELAYGPQGPPSIGPDQLLIFEVELLEIVR